VQRFDPGSIQQRQLWFPDSTIHDIPLPSLLPPAVRLPLDELGRPLVIPPTQGPESTIFFDQIQERSLV
jgi:hypothetical protein